MKSSLETDFQKQISNRIEAFVADITVLAHRHALETLAAALAKTSPASTAFRRGGKRSSSEIQRQSEELLDFIKDNPGKRAEEIAKFVGLETRDLSLPLRKLVAAEAIKTEGQKRATRYFPAGAYSRGRKTRRIRKPRAAAKRR
jgi:predicted transcriptional regulator